ncbi:hypothetical protein GCM10011505_37710 [Tistrella bauzanensis]|uniref:Uncharacterized protein n=1 Tax=Tistrella bauzanensis TaxID=657419 RepID=A0ABQ1IVH3_9PROT|nr:hypothetical protein GCM10011505_37710 [Tistrella bauzanensis]
MLAETGLPGAFAGMTLCLGGWMWADLLVIRSGAAIAPFIVQVLAAGAETPSRLFRRSLCSRIVA